MGEGVNVLPQPERWFEFGQSSPSKQAEGMEWILSMEGWGLLGDHTTAK